MMNEGIKIPEAEFHYGQSVFVRCDESGESFPALVSGIRINQKEVDYTVISKEGGHEADGYTAEWLVDAEDANSSIFSLPKPGMLYSACICDGTGRIVEAARGEMGCPACEPLRVIEVGMTMKQLEAITKTAKPAPSA